MFRPTTPVAATRVRNLQILLRIIQREILLAQREIPPKRLTARRRPGNRRPGRRNLQLQKGTLLHLQNRRLLHRQPQPKKRKTKIATTIKRRSVASLASSKIRLAGSRSRDSAAKGTRQ